MFEIVKRIYELQGKNVIQAIGEKNWKPFYSCFRRDVENKQLSVLKKYATMLDLPIDFLISISKYEEVTDDRII